MKALTCCQRLQRPLQAGRTTAQCFHFNWFKTKIRWQLQHRELALDLATSLNTDVWHWSDINIFAQLPSKQLLSSHCFNYRLQCWCFFSQHFRRHFEFTAASFDSLLTFHWWLFFLFLAFVLLWRFDSCMSLLLWLLFILWRWWCY